MIDTLCTLAFTKQGDALIACTPLGFGPAFFATGVITPGIIMAFLTRTTVVSTARC